jgi:hypothetical protein
LIELRAICIGAKGLPSCKPPSVYRTASILNRCFGSRRERSTLRITRLMRRKPGLPTLCRVGGPSSPNTRLSGD